MAFVAQTQGQIGDKHQSILDREDGCRLIKSFCFEVAQGRVVIQDVEATAKSSQDQVVFPALNFQVAHRNGGQAGLELRPGFAAILGKKQAKLGATKQQIGIYMILGDAVHATPLGQSGADGLPGFAAVTGFE